MKILVACEESQAVTIELRKLGHEAYSCDLEPCSGGHPEWHLQVDALELLKMKWDMILAFPPCTYLTVTGNKWFKPEYADRFPTRQQDREDAIKFLWLLQMRAVLESQLKTQLELCLPFGESQTK